MSTPDVTTRTRPSAVVAALLAGVLFAAGLVIGGMTDPRKVQGFLDIGGIGAGRWDPSLGFVMAGALLVSLIAFGRTRQPPWFAERFELPTRNDIDFRLVVGSALFGIGWAIAGYCPGPALASLLTGGSAVLAFVAAMLAGMLVTRRLLLPRG